MGTKSWAKSVSTNSWVKWVFAAYSVIFAIDRILARFFEIGTTDDSSFVVWCALLAIWMSSETMNSSSKSTHKPTADTVEDPTPLPPEDPQ